MAAIRLQTHTQLSLETNAWREVHQTMALVPTMGALHPGHLALVETAKRVADRVVVSIFVNPLQFGPNEDLARYPRDLDQDVNRLNQQGLTDAVFAPDVSLMYPEGQSQTQVVVPAMARVLCGQARPTHFLGVTTVVAKLFNLVRPDFAVFGEKDAQQLAIVKQMVGDLNFPVKIIGVPTVREPSGLALSSRNQYLSTAEKMQAAHIYQALQRAQQEFHRGQHDPRCLERQVRKHLAEVGLIPEYVSIVDHKSLTSVDGEISKPATLAIACPVGAARLIDNILLSPGS